MKKHIFTLISPLLMLAVVFALSGLVWSAERKLDDGKLRIIVFGAHPDDCEHRAGGVAAMWAAQGHPVKFVSVKKADIVMAHRPNDYHPDHRYTGILMQDAAFMVTVKFFCTDVPQLAKNPVFLYLSDDFQKPNPFEPTVVVAIDDVFEKKVDALWSCQSQIESLWSTGNFEKIVPVPTDPVGRKERRQQFSDRFARRWEALANKYRTKLIELYGEKKGKSVKYAEAFELCEYGRRPSPEELKKLFPFFDR